MTSTLDSSKSPFLSSMLRDYDADFRQQVFGEFSKTTANKEVVSFKELQTQQQEQAKEEALKLKHNKYVQIFPSDSHTSASIY
jgi:hypothetical protein